MKRGLLAVLVFLAVSVGEAAAQNIAFGERIAKRRFEHMTWLRESAPMKRPFIFLEFYHTSSDMAESSLSNLFYLSTEFGDRFSVIVITREEESRIAPMLSRYLSPNFGAVVDPTGEMFNSFEVVYLPFGILVDERGRALWMGNSTQLSSEILSNILKRR